MDDITKKLHTKMLLFNKIISETNQSDQPTPNQSNKKAKVLMTASSNYSNKENCTFNNNQPYTYFNVKLQSHSNMSSVDMSSSTKHETKPPQGVNKMKKQLSQSRLTTATNNNDKPKKNKPMNHDVSSRLYNYGFYIKNKQIQKMKEEDRKRKQRMSPQILAKSRSMSKDSRNVEERLYPEKNKTKQNNPSKSPSGYIEEYDALNHNKKSIKAFKGYSHHIKPKQDLNCSFRPQLNNNSLRIATNLEPSIVRLTHKSKSKSKSKSKPSNASLIKLSYNYQKINHDAMLSSSPSRKTPTHLAQLYTSGLRQMRSKEKQYKQNLSNKFNEYLQFDFKPRLNHNDNHMPRSVSQLDIYLQQTQWQKKLNATNMNYKAHLDSREQLNCTFTPSINKIEVKNDDEFIEKHLGQINEYVMRRRKSIEKENEERMYRKKRLCEIEDGENKGMRCSMRKNTPKQSPSVSPSGSCRK